MRQTKRIIKRILLGRYGARPRKIRLGVLRGLQFNVDTGSKSMRLIGFDEREIASTVRRTARRAVSALDVGANDGWYATYFASLPNVEQVYAFEPDPGNTERLRANLHLNGPACTEKTTICEEFVGNRNDDGWCSLDERVPDLKKPALIKIDVDGGELDVLKGARKHLQSGEVVLVVEVHSVELERRCIDFLRELGYGSRIIHNGWYRVFVPETRPSEHNRWFEAQRS